ncbi:MAG: peptidoglycan DD-metalloendopeptidase family protein [Pseudomonadota bacterium]
MSAGRLSRTPLAAKATAILAGILGLLAPAPAPSGPTDPLSAAQQALAGAEEALRAAGDGEGQLAALVQAVRAQELVLAVHRETLRRVGERAGSLTTVIEMNRARIGELVAALQSLTTAPRSAMFAYPGGPLRAARAETLLASITPALEERRVRLVAELDQLGRLRVEQDVARLGATEALEALQDLRARTAIAIDERRASLPPSRLLRAQADRARETARTIGALGEALADLIPPAGGEPGEGAGFEALRGQLLAPVAGRLTAEFGDPDPWGEPGAGIVMTAPAVAEVASPAAGTVRFAGPLEGYGQIVIIEPAPDWLITLAGLAVTDRSIGEIVAAGEHLGALAVPGESDHGETIAGKAAKVATGTRALPGSAENLLAQKRRDDLINDRQVYIEIRREGVPINPAPWFAGME